LWAGSRAWPVSASARLRGALIRALIGALAGIGIERRIVDKFPLVVLALAIQFFNGIFLARACHTYDRPTTQRAAPR
jgi:hypothetical protein